MRPAILNEGYGFGTKLLFSVIQVVTRERLPDAARLTFYRPDFYGSKSKELTHEAMRGPSAWSVAERELMAAYVSRVNECPFCIAAHTATASLATGNESTVSAALADLDTAPINDGVRATLRMLDKLTRDSNVSAEYVRALLDKGVSRQQVEDALAICYAFNVTNRLANAFGFEVLTPEAFQAGARHLLRRGYR
jgi:uncharacterized peroxidase-related enzyme